jgi:hypothetical protein
LTARCSRIEPIATRPTASCARGKKNRHGYHCATFTSPLAISKTALATRTNTLSRSSPCSSERTGGQAHSRGWTVHSFTSSSGMQAIPVATWMP